MAEDDDRELEWAAAPKTEIADPVTAPHDIETELRAAFERGRAQGDAAGFTRGHAAGVLEGRADVRAGDVEDGIEMAMEAIRATLFAAGESATTAAEIADAVKRRIRRG